MSVRVALAQFSGHIDKNVNIEKAENLARQAAGNGAKVVCFPELSTTIYFCFDRDKKWFETAEPVPGPAVDRLRKVARETGTVIVYPLYENDSGVLYNTAGVIGPDGGLIGKYRKMSHPADPPHGEVRRDARRRAVLLPARQPRLSRVRHPVRPEDRHPDLLRPPLPGGRARARAQGRAPRCWCRPRPTATGSARCGRSSCAAMPSPTCSTWAASTRWARTSAAPPTATTSAPRCSSIPKGGVLCRAGDKEDEILYADIDPKTCDDVRDLWGFFKFRRPDAYGDVARKRRCEVMTADLFVKDCRVVKPDVVVDCGLAIRDGSIAAVLRPGETVPARRTHRRGRALRHPRPPRHASAPRQRRPVVRLGLRDGEPPRRHRRRDHAHALRHHARLVHRRARRDAARGGGGEPGRHALSRHHRPRAADRRDPAHGRGVRRALVQDVHGLQGPRDLAERHPGHGRRSDLLGVPAGARHSRRAWPSCTARTWSSSSCTRSRSWPPGARNRGLVRRPARLRRAGGHPAHVPVRRGGGRPAPHPPHGRGARLRVPAPEGVGSGPRGHGELSALPGLRQGHRPRRAGQGEPAAARAGTTSRRSGSG